MPVLLTVPLSVIVSALAPDTSWPVDTSRKVFWFRAGLPLRMAGSGWGMAGMLAKASAPMPAGAGIRA